jgi:diguanylate cyclase (GGDEF)-like protein
MKVARPEVINVLLIEDDLVDEMATLRTIVREALPYRTKVARSVAEARRMLAKHTFDVILADYQLADGNSFDLMDDFADQLVIFVTGAWDAAAAARALRLGVHDYMIKDTGGTYLNLLNYRVETALGQRRLAARLRESEARLQAILDHAPASISAYDESGHLILSNRHHARSAQDHAGPPTRPSDLAPHQRAAYESEDVCTHADGSEHTYLTVHFPMPDTAGHEHAVGAISVDITARKRAEQHIHTLAYFDPLTTLPNRRMLIDRLQQAVATSARHGSFGAVFFIDLDHFKALNDTLGHDHGDLLLIEVGRRLLACVRSEDTVARIGGDEFVVMIASLDKLPAAAATQAAIVGTKILAAVGQPCLLREHTHTVTPSVGVSLFHGRELSIEEVIKRADVAMYQAKSAGRGTLRFFDPLMQAAQDASTTLAVDLRAAVEAGQLRLHLQAQIDAHDGLVGAEALLRWHHPHRGLLQPEHFMALAEQSGLIVPIGRWVVEAACRQLGHWRGNSRMQRLRIAVNVSARQFRHDDFVEHVARCLYTSGVQPGQLRLELRESLMQADTARSLEKMRALDALGVSLVLEDFGISCASLSHLKQLPLKQIKVSQTLVRNVPEDRHDAALVKALVGIAAELGLTTLAAGVETVQQRDALLGLGCTTWQGFLFGQPVRASRFEAIYGDAKASISL